MSDVKEVDEKSIAADGFRPEDEDALGDASDSAVDPWMYVAIIDAWSIYAEPVQARGTACRIKHPFSEDLPRSSQVTWSAIVASWASTRSAL
jgi:hypothetical protein